MKSPAELAQEARSRVNGHDEPGAIALLERDERAHQGADESTMWCPECEERAVPMRDGTCGFCDTPLVDPPPREEWPHTEGVMRRQVVDDEERLHGRIKRANGGRRARGAVLPEPTEEEQRIARELEDEQPRTAPTRSPILDWLTEHGPGTSSVIAGAIGRKTSNVATRLRQLEQGGFVRRTGNSLSLGRGGPQIEWELAREDKAPTNIDEPIAAPLSPDTDLKRRYFDALLALVARDDCPLHVFDRLECLVRGG